VDNAVLYREAQAAVQARDDMLSVVSHDLGNPLSAIRIGTSLLLRGIPPEEREQGGWYHLESIRQSAEQMERLINDLLEVKRLEAGKVTLERRPTAVEPLLRSVHQSFAPLAGQRGLKIHLGCGPVRKEGWINVDLYGEPDLMLDLREPIAYNRFKKVLQ
jgi:signal transduction histidine kinase